MLLETTTLKDLQSPLPEVRVKALEILYHNARTLYGDTNPTTVAELRRLEAARSELTQCFWSWAHEVGDPSLYSLLPRTDQLPFYLSQSARRSRCHKPQANLYSRAP